MVGFWQAPSLAGRARAGRREHFLRPHRRRLETNPLSSGAMRQRQEPPAPLGAHVLIAEDDEPTATLLADALGRSGYRITVAADGERAMDVFASGEVDVLLLSRRLPKVDGLALLERIRANEHPQLPVVLLTRSERWQDVRERADPGWDALLSSPYDTEAVRRLVRDLLSD